MGRMRRASAVAATAVTLLLAGCGDGTAGTRGRGDPATPAGTRGPVELTQVVLVSGSDAGGAVDAVATVLDSRRAVREFTSGFGDRMRRRLGAAVAAAEVPPGHVLAGAVVAVGCDPPTQVYAERTGEGLRITAAKVTATTQCLVPVTTVALVTVDAPAG